MQYTLPSDNINLLKTLIGQKITKVSRQLLESDMKQENYEQMADGPTELVFSNDRVVSFFPLTEIFSVGVTNTEMHQYGDSYIYKDLTDNLFWKQRVGQAIMKVLILKSANATEKNPMEFGVEFEFENDTRACVEFIDEGEFPDTLRIIEKYEETECIKTVVE